MDGSVVLYGFLTDSEKFSSSKSISDSKPYIICIVNATDDINWRKGRQPYMYFISYIFQDFIQMYYNLANLQ
jgi:hypothetical protein